jgi:hypothetical protein
MPSDGAKLYKGPIAISDRTVINVAPSTKAGNHTELEGVYAPPAGLAPPRTPRPG